ncbi:MAG: NAD-dependent epimerase/dehydratase family protein [Chlorobi bacterium]|nr:NAD-dependent epimerase/dehydratase family protein [Chlorobiota bacterium]
MKIAITGATGFIGSTLVDALLQRGDSLRCLVRSTSNLRWLEDKNVELVYGSLSDEKSLHELVDGVDMVYHIAGVVKSKTKEGYYRGNVYSTENLLNACLEVNPGLSRFVHISSLTAVGPSPGPDQPVNEETPPHPITTYGKSKLEAEKRVLAAADKLPVTIVRPPAVYGPRDTEILIFFKAVQTGLQTMIGFNQKLVSLIHVDDLVRGIILAGESPAAVGETYFISSETFYNWKDVGDITARALGKHRLVRIPVPHAVVYAIAFVAELFSYFRKQPATLNLEKARDLVQSYWTCDTAKASRDLGYHQAVSIEEGVEKTVRWYREQGWI